MLWYLEYITLMDLRGLLQLSNCYPKIGGILGQITIQQFFSQQFLRCSIKDLRFNTSAELLQSITTVKIGYHIIFTLNEVGRHVLYSKPRRCFSVAVLE
jgi:hypothetical protein